MVGALRARAQALDVQLVEGVPMRGKVQQVRVASGPARPDVTRTRRITSSTLCHGSYASLFQTEVSISLARSARAIVYGSHLSSS